MSKSPRLPAVRRAEAAPPSASAASGDAPPSPDRDQEWGRAIRSGDVAAFEAVFHTYYNGLCVYANGFVRCRDVAEEIVAEVFARIWEQRENLDERSRLRRFLYVAVRNQALNYLRVRQNRERLHGTMDARRAPPGMGSPPATPEEELHARDLAAVVAAIVEALPGRSREAFLLSRQQGLAHAEIAEVMGISVSTVEKHMVRATTALAEHVWQWMRSG